MRHRLSQLGQTAVVQFQGIQSTLCLRNRSPHGTFPYDLVGIVTAEDLMEVDTKISNDIYSLTREWLVDDLSELSGFSDSSSVLPFQSCVNRTSNLVEPLGLHKQALLLIMPSK